MPVVTFLKGPDLVAVALAATFQVYLPDEVDAINAAWNDAATVPALVHPAKYFSERHYLEPGFPDLPVLMIGMMPARQQANAANNANAGWARIDYGFEAMLYLVADKLEIAERWGRRYATAMWEVIMKHQGLDYQTPGVKGIDGLSGVDLLEMGYSASEQSPMTITYAVSWTGVVHTLQGVGENA